MQVLLARAKRTRENHKSDSLTAEGLPNTLQSRVDNATGSQLGSCACSHLCGLFKYTLSEVDRYMLAF